MRELAEVAEVDPWRPHTVAVDFTLDTTARVDQNCTIDFGARGLLRAVF